MTILVKGVTSQLYIVYFHVKK